MRRSNWRLLLALWACITLGVLLVDAQLRGPAAKNTCILQNEPSWSDSLTTIYGSFTRWLAPLSSRRVRLQQKVVDHSSFGDGDWPSQIGKILGLGRDAHGGA